MEMNDMVLISVDDHIDLNRRRTSRQRESQRGRYHPDVVRRRAAGSGRGKAPGYLGRSANDVQEPSRRSRAAIADER